ncbi:MAG: hypothetical protein VCD16_14065 [Planctomycetota bacterium]
MVFSSGCTSSAGIRRSRLVEPEAPDAVVAEAVVEAADGRTEVVAGESEQPIEAKTVSDTTGSEVAEILQQTRGAVFASLSTPVGAGPPASAVKLDEVAENAADSGVQDSVSSQTGGDATDTTVAEAPEASAPTEDESQEPAVTEEVAEENVAEAVPEPAEETPAREETETTEAEVARVESPPESVATPGSQPPAAEVLTSNNPGASPVGGGRSNTASVLFLVLGGIGAALILIRKRVAA